MLKLSLFIRRFLLIALPLAIAGCSREAAVVQPPPLEVMIAQPIKEKIINWDNYTGTVAAMESPDIKARVQGQIKEVAFKEGEEVTAGTALFIIDSDPFVADLNQAKGQLTTWEGKLKFAEDKIAIYAPLEKKGTVSKEELLQANSLKAESLGNIETAKGKIKEAEVNIGYCKITSPIDGKVGQAMLTKGDMVNPTNGKVLTTVVSVDPMYVYFYVNERALLSYQKVLADIAAATAKNGQVAKESQYPNDSKDSKISKDAAKENKDAKDAKDSKSTKDPNHTKDNTQGKDSQAAEQGKDVGPKIPVELARLSDADYPFKGVIDFIDNRVDPNTGSVKVRAKFANPKGADGSRLLTPGLFARIRIAITPPYPAVLIADRAILTDQSLKYVLVVNKAKKNEVERVDITASNRIQPDGLRSVTSGLKGDEWVIVEGVNRARPGIIVNPKEESMPRQPTSAK
jgi:RND family efflux transporter MFP subunit